MYWPEATYALQASPVIRPLEGTAHTPKGKHPP